MACQICDEYGREHCFEHHKHLEKAKLTEAERAALPASAFVFPKERKYPIHDKQHALAAIYYSSGRPEEARVRAAVRARYPGIVQKAKVHVDRYVRIRDGKLQVVQAHDRGVARRIVAALLSSGEATLPDGTVVVYDSREKKLLVNEWPDPTKLPDATDELGMGVHPLSAGIHKVRGAIPNKPGVSNWVEEAGHLPAYIDDVAGALYTKRGFSVSHAIATAVNRVKRWCRGGDGVKPDTRAKACRAVEQWEAMRARTGRVAKAMCSQDEVRAVLELPDDVRIEACSSVPSLGGRT